MTDNNKKIHLGCGTVNYPGWLNVDIDSPTADMLLDLTKPLPFADCSVTHIFNEHFIEHVSRKEAVSFLVECRRVLSTNGAVRITTPNLRFLIASYLADNKREWDQLWQPDTLCLLMNEGMRSWGHQFIYDADELVRVLSEAGFNSITFQEYRKSQDKELIGLESRPFHNELIVEARKIELPKQSIDRQVLKKNEDQWPIKLTSDLMERFQTTQQAITEQATHIQSVEAELSARGKYITGLEQTIADQATHIHGVGIELSARGQHITGLEQTITDQVTHIHGIEAELSARGQNIAGLQQIIADQATHIRGAEAEVSARGQHITGLEQTIADQATHIHGVGIELSARGQHITGLEQTIADQATHINGVEAALMKFQNSLYGKATAGLGRLVAFVKNKNHHEYKK